FVEDFARAGQLLRTDARLELIRCGFAAGPCLPAAIGAGLIELGRVDSIEPNVGSRYVDGVAVNHPGFAHGHWRRPCLPVLVGLVSEPSRYNNEADEQLSIGSCHCARSGLPVT